MRDKSDPVRASVEPYRCRNKELMGPYASKEEDGNNGMFLIPMRTTRGKDHNKGKKTLFKVMVSDQLGWEHVSVSIHEVNRSPTWEEMCAIKRLFFKPEEVVLQYHPAESEYVNIHQYCLHLWRPVKATIPLPNASMV